jgi:thioredoxin-related protein
MKRWLICLSLFAVVVQNCSALEWLTDAPAALRKAREENKVVMLDFTGSDWCGWCMRLKSEVFDQPQFASFAQANLVLVEVDFPRHTSLAPAEQAANNALQRKYKIAGYPTIVLLNASGDEVGRAGYLPGGPGAFIRELEKVPGIRHVDTAAVAPAAPEPAPPPHKAPEFVPIPPTAPMHYGDLALKGISGTKDRRLALINNQTFMAGETAKVKVQDTRIDVTCKEIRDDSVVIVVEGKTQELKITQR